jgi:DNA polymerase-3 subunit alpha
MSKKFQYSCGCSFNVIEGNDPEKTLIEFLPVIENIPLDCTKTWELISAGNTKGCFQLESRLGKSMAKKLKPENIEQLSGLISILRPGCLEAYREGKNVSNHYIDKKNAQESVDYYHPSLEPILHSTYGEMIYQEQAMEIAKVIAGFNLEEADMLRKAIGKKKPEEMAKIKSKFLEGCKLKNTVSTEQAEEIFGWVEKSQRYSFNKSHAVSYAINAYLSAYTKAHFPRVFFASYLRFAKDKIDPKAEIKELVQNANEMDIDISIPDIRNLNKHFILKNQKIYFGLTDIKGFGQSIFDKLIKLLKDKKLYIDNMTWIELLMHILLNINSNASKALIQAGALSFLVKSRTSMLFDFGIASELTKKECEYIISNISKYTTISDAMHDLYHNAKINKNRKSIILTLINAINKPPYSLEDNPEWIADSEDEILGCNITCSKVDMYDVTMTNTTCKDFKNSLFKDNILLCAEIENIGITKTKKGKNPGLEMAFVTVSDGTGLLDSVIFFPESYKMYRNLLFSGNVVIIKGSRAKTGDSLIVEKVYLPST